MLLIDQLVACYGLPDLLFHPLDSSGWMEGPPFVAFLDVYHPFVYLRFWLLDLVAIIRSETATLGSTVVLFRFSEVTLVFLTTLDSLVLPILSIN